MHSCDSESCGNTISPFLHTKLFPLRFHWLLWQSAFSETTSRTCQWRGFNTKLEVLTSTPLNTHGIILGLLFVSKRPTKVNWMRVVEDDLLGYWGWVYPNAADCHPEIHSSYKWLHFKGQKTVVSVIVRFIAKEHWYNKDTICQTETSFLVVVILWYKYGNWRITKSSPIEPCKQVLGSTN